MSHDQERYKLCLECLSCKLKEGREKPLYGDDGVTLNIIELAIIRIRVRIHRKESWSNAYLPFDYIVSPPRGVAHKLCHRCPYVLEHVVFAQKKLEIKD